MGLKMKFLTQDKGFKLRIAVVVGGLNGYSLSSFLMDFLTPSALQNLTLKRSKNAQRKVLQSMKIPFLVRPDGSLAVPVQVLENMFNVSAGAAQNKKRTQPNLINI
jgi:hypothetical protein